MFKSGHNDLSKQYKTYRHTCRRNAHTACGVQVNEGQQKLLVSLDMRCDVVVVDEALQDRVVQTFAGREQTSHDPDQVTGLFGLNTALNILYVLPNILKFKHLALTLQLNGLCNRIYLQRLTCPRL